MPIIVTGTFKNKYKQNKNIQKKSWLIPAIDLAILTDMQWECMVKKNWKPQEHANFGLICIP